jgi:hydrogenase nickel incorporation protein HypB
MTQVTIPVVRNILEANERLAATNRQRFEEAGILAINLMSSPGAGKTSLLERTIEHLSAQLRIAVIEGDIQSSYDAERIQKKGVQAVQINTDGACHLDGNMVQQAMAPLDLGALDLLVIENVGNLVCPASYDLGEDLRVVLLSVTEGEDKPLKYPPMFQSANVVIISKVDLAVACGYDRDAALANIRRVAPKARVFETSAKTGQGLDAWREFLLQQKREQEAQVW